ncbi:hypothetical protein DS2_18363 [Catenovulum agarivorans DS-2]|uniref:Lipoprotein n=1 Tax=Catenovulum agarivorans DS-2 TaxID=1328313 RepID=W7Q632_9ALTE|nr:hypothetical protein [Catenovulum agarivorans]EWH08234.1 hypothetical protein DS2_18363 [Catenovulum agarivorans DS-2]
MSKTTLVILLASLIAACKSTDVQRFQESVAQVTSNMVAQANNQKKPVAQSSAPNQSVKRLSIVDTITGVQLLDNAQTRELIDQDYKIITPEEFANLPRADKQNRIKQDMDTLGFGILDISQTFNKVQQTALVYAKQQYDLIENYNTLALNHRDVQSFLYANQGKDEQALATAIAEFDKSAAKPSEKIGPKIAAYEKANKKIFNKNAELTAIISLQILELGTVVMDDPSQFLKMEGLLLLANYYKVEKASSILMDRLTLAQHANSLIADDKALIDITKQIQQKQNLRARIQR